MFRRILIANRGEIVRRVARTCRRLGVEVLAIHSDPDQGADYLQDADLSLRLPGSAAKDTYLNIEAIVALAVEHGAEAIHPGYGFLSENAAFVRAVEAAGIAFIGPTAETVDMLGDKSRAKRAMQEAEVPTVPGSPDATVDIEEILRLSQGIGYPLLLKPSAGGGGKGMTVVRNPATLRDAAIQGVRLAEANFGDGSLIVERYIERPRHVEVQVVGDGRGQAVHVYERECSLQRRHQKVIEEAPALRLSANARERLLETAVRGARAINYRNAGTFEFIANENDEFFFLEVNTRLQVEHPVSEEVTGVDLVEWQMRIAAGEDLPCAQEDIRSAGAAVEARIYAEDPENGFLPSPGHAHHVKWPDSVRVEAAFDTQGTVPSQYDPMIAKIISRGETRNEALDKLATALRQTEILGLSTNIGFLLGLIEDPAVRAGDIHTQFLDGRVAGSDRAPSVAQTAAIAAVAVRAEHLARHLSGGNPWYDLAGDRPALNPVGSHGVMVFRVGQEAVSVEILSESGKACLLAHGDMRFTVENIEAQDGLVRGRINDAEFVARTFDERIDIMCGGVRRAAEPFEAVFWDTVSEGGDATAPMHGVVVQIFVQSGDSVSKGDPLVIIEAMKMENIVRASVEGTVGAVQCAVGEQVASGQLLVRVEDSGTGSKAS